MSEAIFIYCQGRIRRNIFLYDREILTVCEKRSVGGALTALKGDILTLRIAPRASDRESLFDVQRPFLTVRSDSVVVENSVSKVGILLYLGNENARAYCVNKTRGNKEAVALFNGYGFEDIARLTSVTAFLKSSTETPSRSPQIIQASSSASAIYHISVLPTSFSTSFAYISSGCT